MKNIIIKMLEVSAVIFMSFALPFILTWLITSMGFGQPWNLDLWTQDARNVHAIFSFACAIIISPIVVGAIDDATK